MVRKAGLCLAAIGLALWLALLPPPAAAQSGASPRILPPISRSMDQRIGNILAEARNNPDRAISGLTSLMPAAETPGERVVLLTLRAEQEAKAERLDRAIDDVNAAIAISTAYPLPYYFRASFDMRRGNRERALRDLTLAMQLEPKFDGPQGLRARLHHSERRYPEALADYAAYLAKRPDDAATRHQYAVALKQTGQPAKALVEIDRALVRNPHSVPLLVDKAFFLSAVRDDARAVELIDRLIADAAMHPGLRMLRGELNLARGDFAAAEADLKQAFDLALAGGLPHPYCAIYLEVARLRQGKGNPADLARMQQLANVTAWPSMLGDKLTGAISSEALLANGQDVVASVGNAGPMAQAHFFIAQRELAQGRRDAAMDAYRAAIATGASWTNEYGWSQRELERLGAR